MAFCALTFIGIALFLKRPAQPAAPAPVAVAPETPATPEPPLTPMPPPPPRPLTAEEQQATNDAEIDRLQEWSRNDDPQSLSNILADLTSSQKDVRDAAIEATKQFDSTNAIPALKAAAANATDTDEQIAMLEAVKFIELPPLTFSPPTPGQAQAAQQQRAQRQAQMPQPNQTQNPPPSPSQTGPN